MLIIKLLPAKVYNNQLLAVAMQYNNNMAPRELNSTMSSPPWRIWDRSSDTSLLPCFLWEFCSINIHLLPPFLQSDSLTFTTPQARCKSWSLLFYSWLLGCLCFNEADKVQLDINSWYVMLPAMDGQCSALQVNNPTRWDEGYGPIRVEDMVSLLKFHEQLVELKSWSLTSQKLNSTTVSEPSCPHPPNLTTSRCRSIRSYIATPYKYLSPSRTTFQEFQFWSETGWDPRHTMTGIGIAHNIPSTRQAFLLGLSISPV